MLEYLATFFNENTNYFLSLIITIIIIMAWILPTALPIYKLIIRKNRLERKREDKEMIINELEKLLALSKSSKDLKQLIEARLKKLKNR